ncbi:MAG: hypothetical protein JXR63_12060 [Spirochaetales bacterium]|nr:hypothetical protein [Spirochaetales bacterium]
MKTKIKIWFYFIPLIHIGFISLFVSLYFSGQDYEVYSKEIKDISVSGTYYGSGKKLKTLSLTNKGFSFAFNNDNPLVIESASPVKAEIQGLSDSEEAKGQVSVLFDDNTKFVFKSVSNEVTDVYIEASSDVSAVVFPFFAQDGSKLKSQKGLKVLLSPQKNEAYTIFLQPGDVFLSDEDKLRVSLRNGKAKFSIKKQKVFSADSEFFLTLITNGVVSDEDYKKAYEKYESLVYSSLSRGRYSESRGWKNVNSGSYDFTAELATMFSSMKFADESLSYPLPQVKTAAIKENFVNFPASVFFGNIRDSFINEKDEISQKVSKSEALLNSQDFSFLAEDPYFLVKLDYFGQVKFLNSITMGVKKILSSSVVNPEIAVGIILNIVNYCEYQEVKCDQYSETLRILSNTVLSNIYQYDDSFLISYNDVYSPVLGIKASKALILVGKELGTSNLVKIGQNLFISAAKYARNDGALRISLADSNSRYIGPEDFFFYFKNGENYPHYQSFTTHDGKVIKFFHAAKVFEVSSDKVAHTHADGREENLNRLIIKSKFTKNVGSTYLFAVSGLSSYSHTSMRGYPVWSNDRSFEKYSSGFFFDQNLTTFFFKNAQQSGNDEFIIFYK